MEGEEAERRSRQAVAQAGLPVDHEALYGARAGIALETALRNWAMSLGWSYPAEKQALDRIVNWLAQFDHITDDEAASLRTATRVRNHCAHGRWTLLADGQVDHLIQNAETWCQRLQSFRTATAPIKSYSANVSLEQTERIPELRPWVAWAFKDGKMKLRSIRSFSLGVILLCVPIMIWGVGAVGSIEAIPFFVSLSAKATGLTTFSAAFIPMLWIALMAIITLGVGLGVLFAGISRLNTAGETSLAAASWIWVKNRSRRELLTVERLEQRRFLSVVEYTGACSTCGAELQFEPASTKSESAVMAKCTDWPAIHRYVVDPSTMTATKLRP